MDVFAVGIFRVYDAKYVIRREMGNHSCLTCFFNYTDLGSIQNRGADMSLARPGRKQANVSVRMA